MTDQAQRIAAVREFSRVYTAQIGLLNEGLLDSPFPLTEARVIYELAQYNELSAVDIAATLQVDTGYLSRILRRFEKQGLVVKRRSSQDRRRVMVSLSRSGRSAFAELDAGSREQVTALLGSLSVDDQRHLIAAMETVQRLLTEPSGGANGGRGNRQTPPTVLRPHRPGDIGWVIQRHGELYGASHGWDETFEALVADIASRFVTNFDPAFERSWIAERDGERLGSIFLMRKSKTVGQLRMLLVEPAARGSGLGRRLVGECVSHARYLGYKRLGLYTSKGLEAARRLYEAEGFVLTKEFAEDAWSKTHIGQWWELEL